jgi:hypothetical protein
MTMQPGKIGILRGMPIADYIRDSYFGFPTAAAAPHTDRHDVASRKR